MSEPSNNQPRSTGELKVKNFHCSEHGYIKPEPRCPKCEAERPLPSTEGSDFSERVDIAIANLIYSNLSLEKIQKIPKWLLEAIETNKPQFRAFIASELARREKEITERGWQYCVNATRAESWSKEEFIEAIKRR